MKWGREMGGEVGSREGFFVLRPEIVHNDTGLTGDGCKNKTFRDEGGWIQAEVTEVEVPIP